MNIPYVKNFDVNGILINPITQSYLNTHPNRKSRRSFKNRPRFIGNGKNFPLTCTGVHSYKRVLQTEFGKSGDKKHIYHYLLN